MFTGLIEEMGRVISITRGGRDCVITVSAQKLLSDVKTGDSIAVNGVCLTATSVTQNSFTADIMNETLSRSSLGGLKSGDRVNLERAMPSQGRFGGHIVSGHIDGTGAIERVVPDRNAVWYFISAKPAIMRYIVEKGSAAIDGISLTVAKADESGFAVSVIPHTAAQTALSYKKTGDIVNIENDIIAKYTEKLLASGSAAVKNDTLTKETLIKNGYL